jgi:hypothetical protein
MIPPRIEVAGGRSPTKRKTQMGLSIGSRSRMRLASRAEI